MSATISLWGKAPTACQSMHDPNLSAFIWSVTDLLRSGHYKQNEGDRRLPYAQHRPGFRRKPRLTAGQTPSVPP